MQRFLTFSSQEKKNKKKIKEKITVHVSLSFITRKIELGQD